ncbi:MAG: transposase [Gammaproteobacteria bacterium]|nr:transposase [Gammaproteobacteria bacterium]
MSYSALNKGRFSQPRRAYFVTTVTHCRDPLFLDLGYARVVVDVMRVIHSQQLVYSLAWVLMPDHVHWLFQLGEKRSLSHVMFQFKGVSARRLNEIGGRRGPVWQKAYYDRALRDNENLEQTARYIVANPLRAGLVTNIGDYSHWDAVWL